MEIMGITFGIQDLNKLSVIVECVKIYSHFPKNCYRYTYSTCKECRNITIFLRSIS